MEVLTEKRFAVLFQGRLDAYGTDDGGCDRKAQYSPQYVEGTINPVYEEHEWEGRINAHLCGTRPTGIYPMRDGNIVHWGCIDWDGGDGDLAHARNVSTVLGTFGIESFVERTRSKGFHLWVFCAEWVPALLMRQALLAACQLVDAPTKEINPKQVELDNGKLGNYVRLPYPGWYERPEPHIDWDARQVMIDKDGMTIPWHPFVDQAWVTRCNPSHLSQVAFLYTAPKRKVPPIPPIDIEMLGEPAKRLGKLAFYIYENGPREPGTERGHTLYKLGCLIREDGNHTYEEALKLMLDWDDRYGKFQDRGDGYMVQHTLDRAWGII